MGLRETLEQIKQSAVTRIPEEAREVMREAIRQLAESGQVERVLGPGAALPAVAVQDEQGETVPLAVLRDGRPLVLQFYRGHW